MPENPYEPPQETSGREVYYEAALLCIVLFCDKCTAALDPDTDLGPNHSFDSDSYYVLLGDEAYRRGWLVEHHSERFRILCPACASSSLPNSTLAR